MKKWLQNLNMSVISQDEDHFYSGFILAGLALILFAQHAWIPGFFQDGHLYAALGKHAAQGGNWLIPYLSETTYSQFDQHPPLFFIIEGLFFKVVGVSWTSARLFTVLWAFLSMFVIFKLALFFSHRRMAFLSVALFILLPPLFKKSRSPNIDIALMGTILSSLACYLMALYYSFEQKRKRSFCYWHLCGILFGVALLIKGPPALIIPMTITLHLILTGELRRLLSLVPWTAFCLGLMIFALWPISLYLTGHIDLFQSYWNAQVLGTVIGGRGRSEFMLDTYPYYLLENAPLWFLLSLWGVIKIVTKIVKEGFRDPFMLLFLSLYLVVLIPFSLVRWKYSNYIVPFFPAMAVLAAYPLSTFGTIFHAWTGFLFKRCAIVVALILLIFPLTIKVSRDRELIQLTEKLKAEQVIPGEWAIVNNAYSFFHVANLMAWLDMGEVKNYSQEQLEQPLTPGTIILLSEVDSAYLRQKNKKEFDKKFKQLSYFAKEKIFVFITP